MAIDTQTSVDPNSIGSNASLDQRATAEYVSTSTEMMMDAEALSYVHPDYASYVSKWRKYADCYQSRRIYSYIHKHPREHQDVFDNRVKRGYFFNYTSAIVDLFVSYLFQSGISRTASGGDGVPSDVTGAFTDLYEDSDRLGTKYSLFMQIAATFAQIAGHVGILVDAPSLPPDGYASRQEEAQARHRPYLTLVRAEEILDWELDADGKFEWVKIEITRPQDRTWKNRVDEETRYFLIWSKSTLQEWVLKNETSPDGKSKTSKAILVSSKEHTLKEVPLVILRNEKSLDHPWFGESSVRDIADINLAILNWCSYADEEIANRCLNILTMNTSDSDKPVEISQNNVLEYEQGCDRPEYLTPGATPLELIGKQIDRGRDEIYRLAKLGGSTGLLGVREATSGVAYAFEFNETNQSLCRKAEFLEQSELEVHRLVAKWLTKQFTGSITYPREFGVDDFLTELQFLADARATLTSETAIKKIEQKVCDKIFSKDKEDLRNKVSSEIAKGKISPMGLAEWNPQKGNPKQGATSTKPPTQPTGDGETSSKTKK